MIAATLLCLVVGITDGDTITARCPTEDAAHPYQQVKVRLGAIDAPERKQPYGERARQALAWWYRAYSREQTPEARGQYEFAQTEARAKRAGLWADQAPVAPWEWRRQKKQFRG